MSPRYFLDLIDGQEIIRDVGGMDAVDLDTATDHAQAVLDAIRKTARLTRSPGPWEIVIRDRNGRPLRRIAVA